MFSKYEYIAIKMDIVYSDLEKYILQKIYNPSNVDDSTIIYKSLKNVINVLFELKK